MFRKPPVVLYVVRTRLLASALPSGLQVLPLSPERLMDLVSEVSLSLVHPTIRLWPSPLPECVPLMANPLVRLLQESPVLNAFEWFLPNLPTVVFRLPLNPPRLKALESTDRLMLRLRLILPEAVAAPAPLSKDLIRWIG